MLANHCLSALVRVAAVSSTTPSNRIKPVVAHAPICVSCALNAHSKLTPSKAHACWVAHREWPIVSLSSVGVEPCFERSIHIALRFLIRYHLMRGILSQPNIAHPVKGVYRGQPRQSGLVSVPTRDARGRTASTVIDRDGKLLYLSKLFNYSVIHS